MTWWELIGAGVAVLCLAHTSILQSRRLDIAMKRIERLEARR